MGDHLNREAWVVSTLRKLALGRDLSTEEMLAPDHVLHRPEVIRALMIAVHHLEGAGITNSASDRLRAGESWTDTEERELQEMYSSGKSTPEIAHSLQRTRGSIRARLVKLEVIDDFQAILDEERESRRR